MTPEEEEELLREADEEEHEAEDEAHAELMLRWDAELVQVTDDEFWELILWRDAALNDKPLPKDNVAYPAALRIGIVDAAGQLTDSSAFQSAMDLAWEERDERDSQ
jgi:hypothetical protein